jgi:hypothetical protein
MFQPARLQALSKEYMAMDRESGHARSIAKMLPRVWFDVSTLAQPRSEHDVVDYLDADARGDAQSRADRQADDIARREERGGGSKTTPSLLM